MDIAEYRKASHENWQRMASGWESWTDFLARTTRPVTEQLVSALAPEPGQTILELAAGVGVVGFTAAPMLGDGGRLIMTDFAEEMLEAARRRGASLGVTNVDYRVMDAERMDLEDDCVDGVLCRWGYMLMADPAAAFVETRRVLRQGGRLSFAVWGAPEDNPFVTTVARVLVERGHLPPPEPGVPGIFALADPGRIEELVTGAGFERPQLSEVRVAFVYRDIDEFWRYTNEISGPLAAVIAELDERERSNVRTEVEASVEQFRGDTGYELPGVAITALAN